MLRNKHMGFKSVRRVEIKAETTTPGELRTTTDATGARVTAGRGRRTLPKLEFTVDEDGAVLHGPQRGAYPYYSPSPQQSNVQVPTLYSPPTRHSEYGDESAPQSLVTFTGNPSTAEVSPAQNERLAMPDRAHSTPSVPTNQEESEAKTQMKECVLNDTRATTLALKYDSQADKFVCGSSIERFSGHTGVCRVLGSKKYPIVSHSLRLGDLLRIGSVGLVVCEVNRGTTDATQESLSDDDYHFLKENYLSIPLQQTFHPHSNQDEESHNEHLDERLDGVDEVKNPSGETSDEGESEEDQLEKSPSAASNRKGSGDKTERPSGKKFCYICYDEDEDPETNPLVAPCRCKGDTKYLHVNCLQRWNHNLDADGTNPNQKVCAVTNTEGLDVCSICKSTYMTKVKLEDGRIVSLLAKKLPPPYVTFAVVTQHETRNRSSALTNTRFQLSFANLSRTQQYLTIGRSTNNNMTLRYRTVSQLHAKVKFQDGNFYLSDASSSNGTMLFLSKPLELEWNKTSHVKIGRTILTLKAKKKWRWDPSKASEHDAPPVTDDLVRSEMPDPSADLMQPPFPPRVNPFTWHEARQPRTYRLPSMQEMEEREQELHEVEEAADPTELPLPERECEADTRWNS